MGRRRLANRTRSVDVTSNVEHCGILEDAQERSNLEGWKATVRILPPLEAGVTSEEDWAIQWYRYPISNRLARELR